MKPNKKQIDEMLHALGRPNINIRWKSKTILDKCYRNRIIDYNINESWEKLVNEGYAGFFRQRNFDNSYLYWYYVTEKGMDLLKKLKREGAI